MRPELAMHDSRRGPAGRRRVDDRNPSFGGRVRRRPGARRAGAGAPADPPRSRATSPTAMTWSSRGAAPRLGRRTHGRARVRAAGCHRLAPARARRPSAAPGRFGSPAARAVGRRARARRLERLPDAVRGLGEHRRQRRRDEHRRCRSTSRPASRVPTRQLDVLGGQAVQVRGRLLPAVERAARSASRRCRAVRWHTLATRPDRLRRAGSCSATSPAAPAGSRSASASPATA